MKYAFLTYLFAGLLCLAAGDALAQKKYDPGATDTEIKLGQIGPFSGPASSFALFNRVHEAYARAINAKGGINGRKINLIQRDDAYSPPKALEATRQLIEGEQVLAMVATFGTPSNAAIQKYLNQRKVPQLLAISGASRWNSPQEFPWTTPYVAFFTTEGENYMRYLLKEKPNAKVGVLYQADDFGKDYLKGLRDGLGTSASPTIVKELSYQVADPIVDSQIIDLKASGADVVVLAAQNKFAAQAIRKIHELGWKPLILGAAFSVAGVYVPAGLEASTGVITQSSYKQPSDPAWANDEGMKAYIAFMKEYFPTNSPDDLTAIMAYATSEITAEIFRRCGDELTRENILKQATNLRGLKVSMFLPGITLQTNPDDYTAIKSVRFVRFDGKNSVMFGDVIGESAPGTQ